MQRRAAQRASWPVLVYRLRDAPGDDLSATTTVAQRLAMMWPLALEAWSLSGWPLPAYARGESPVTRRAWGVSPSLPS
ncbi:MAG: hypothetical protein DMF78_17930 [Acidobacteria bacterium]|nr:MAG: hypothetical protein DMF78_17930 [Acidobacteriota bacterium]